MGLRAPRYLAARYSQNNTGTLPSYWDWAAKALGLPIPFPVSELAPPAPALHVRDNLPLSGTASSMKNAHIDDFLPSFDDFPLPDIATRSTAPTRPGGAEDPPGRDRARRLGSRVC